MSISPDINVKGSIVPNEKYRYNIVINIFFNNQTL